MGIKSLRHNKVLGKGREKDCEIYLVSSSKVFCLETVGGDQGREKTKVVVMLFFSVADLSVLGSSVALLMARGRLRKSHDRG